MAYLDNVYAVVQIAPTGIPTYVRLSQNENGRVLKFAISGDALPEGSTVALTGTKPDGAVYSVSGTLAGNVATFNEDEQLTAVAGEWDAKVEVTNSGNLIATGRIKFVIDADPSGGNIPSDSQLDGYIAEMLSLLDAGKAEAYGSPLVASTVAGMIDQNKVYVYTGSETGYTAGNWYYWNGSAWTSGGVYNAVAVSTDTTLSIAGKAADAKATGDDIDALKDDLQSNTKDRLLYSPIVPHTYVYGNMWDDSTKEYGYFNIQDNGNIVEGGTAWYYSPTYIPVKTNDVILYNNARPIVCAYDVYGNVVECLQPGWSGYTVPSGVAYLRFTIPVASATNFYIFKNGTSQTEYKSKTQLYVENLNTGKRVVTVSKVAYCDYTSLTEALYDTYEEACDVVVKEGTYDLVAEYKALFGNTIFDTMTYQTTGMKNFQWGLYIDNRTVKFEAGAQVVCDMSAYTNDASRRFSPFNLGENAIIDGLYCIATNPYYIIHDDFGLDTDPPFTNIIRNCVLVTPEATNGNVIGGGCKKFSTKIVDNCYLDNGTNRPVTMRYHNTNADGALPVVIIKNTRANAIIRVNCYGTQTSKMTAIVNNCQASAIEKAYETEGSADNVNLFTWNNKVT